MRDRRNTNLSTSSAGSTQSSPIVPSRSSLNEKHYTSPSLEEGLLPLPVTKENTTRPLSRRNLALRCLAAMCALVLLVHWGMSRSMLVNSAVPATLPVASDVVVTPDSPTEAMAVLITDKSGAQRWTVSIPPDAPFPLKAGQYQDICTQSEALSSTFSQRSRLGRVKDWRKKSDYYHEDPAYLDVGDAQRTGVLPESPATSNQTCQSSMTFSMATEDVGFGKTLLSSLMTLAGRTEATRLTSLLRRPLTARHHRKAKSCHALTAQNTLSCLPQLLNGHLALPSKPNLPPQDMA
jgi:hypothetical protein